MSKTLKHKDSKIKRYRLAGALLIMYIVVFIVTYHLTLKYQF